MLETNTQEPSQNGIHNAPQSQEIDKKVIRKGESKLELLLAQPDIFQTLRKINSGEIKSYEALADSQHHTSRDQAQEQSRRRGAKGDEAEELSRQEEQGQPIRRIEVQSSNLVGGQLRDYQVEGLNWLYKLYQSNINGILADEMGLGKTIQSIAILALIKSLQEEAGQEPTKHIIIVPKITLGKWHREVQEWCPALRLFQFYGSNIEREEQKQELRIGEWDVLLTTFEIIIKEKTELCKLKFDMLILDEAQRIKNDKSVLSQVLRKFKTSHRVLLTGTPLQNDLTELWALLNFIMPSLFDSTEEFLCLFRAKEDDPNSLDHIIQQIHRLLRPFMLRRLKSDVKENLPPKKEIYLYFGLSPLQKSLYKNILTGNIDVVNGQGGDKIKLLNVLMQLRKVCNHPYLFDKVEPGPPFLDGDHLIEATMKFKVLDCLIPRLVKEKSKLIIFSQMTRLLDILDDFLRYRGYKYCRIDGQTSSLDRDMRIQDFQNPESDKQIFILSTRAGGMGINLHAANTVIIYDSDWNPQVDLQAIDRAHRIGQKKPVTVYRFVTEGSVEEKIIERAARKLKVDHLIMQKGKFRDQAEQKASAQEMMSMIRYGAQEIILSTDSDAAQMELQIDKILELSLQKTAVIENELKQIEDKFNLNSVSLTGEGQKQTDLYMFEGLDYKKEKLMNAAIDPSDLIDIGRREKKQTSYDIDKYYRIAFNNQNQGKEKKKLKGWRALANGGYDHQFFDNQKLDQLEAKETAWNQYQQDQEEYLKQNDNVKPKEWTKKDQATKDGYLSKGFSNWSKKEFFYYIRMCESYGRDNYEKISQVFKSKTIEELIKYSKVFWDNYNKIENGQKYFERVVKGEDELARLKLINEAIEEKFKGINKPEALNIDKLYQNTNTKSSSNSNNSTQEQLDSFSKEEDMLLASCLYKYGYGLWELIKNEFRNYPQFMFNFIAKSRTALELQKRGEQLVQMFQEELQEKKESLMKNGKNGSRKKQAQNNSNNQKSNNNNNQKGKQLKKRQRKEQSSEEEEEDEQEEEDNYSELEDEEFSAEVIRPNGKRQPVGKVVNSAPNNGINKRTRKAAAKVNDKKRSGKR